ncbi:diguanylate cyclase (GGDEF) domain-containing protein [Noviherbaspirillum humi]|uniref:Diguanylate cyclase (GGDEF) domain-containing protein n=1 Tax=Noviherbaspirillum humi TaxID=1688639 RepID=A0A239ITR0_9BURK|nr:diguanylate cyclase [Noviherbaspirillum humi]SNS96772.1 diguanylate cyclase (GGDEF) domain-containing protein [Noviherbaspirillum humi]
MLSMNTIRQALSGLKAPVWSLGASLAFWFCLLSTALTLVIVYVIGISATAKMREQVGMQLANLAFQASDKLDKGMFERYREFELLAARKFLADPAESAADKQRLLDQMKATYPSYAWIGIADLNGKVLAATNGLLVGADVSKRPWFGNALRGVHIGDVHDAKLLASKLPNPTGEPLRFVDVAFPFSDANGRPVGVIGAHLSWSWADDVQRSVLSTGVGRLPAQGIVVASDGTVLLGPQGLIGMRIDLPSVAAAREGRDGYMVERWPDGKQYLVGFSATRGYQSYPGLGWKMLVRQDANEAYAQVREMQQHVFWSGLTIALLFSLLGLFNARRISGPLASLSAAAKDLMSGRSSSLRPVVSGYSEVNGLGSALSALVTDLQANQLALQKLNLSLEQRIADRTADLASSEARLRTITDSIPVLIAYVDGEGRCNFINRVCEQWLGAPPAAYLGATLGAILGEPAYAKLLPQIAKARQGEAVTFDHSRPAGNGVQHLQLQFIPDGMAAGKGHCPHGFYVVAHDVTDTRNYQLALQQDLLTDALTGLPNRAACMQRLRDAIFRARRSGKQMAAMFLDIDCFKAINDTYGHQVGDQVLLEFGRRLRARLRECDMVARLSGDEFVIVAEDLDQAHAAAVVMAEKILDAINSPMQVDGHTVQVSTSIGIAISAGAGTAPNELVRLADQAMYSAKKAGRNRYAIHPAKSLKSEAFA